MRHLSLLRWMLLILALVPAIALADRPAQSGSQLEIAPGKPVVLRAGHATQVSHVRPRIMPSAAIQSATILVTYHGFSPEALAAFQYAVDIWKTQLTSPVPIRVDAYWMPLGPGLLGSAGPTSFARNYPHAPMADTWYPIALANKLAGEDLDTSSPDIVAHFSSSFSNWYFGTDGQTPLNQYDFATTVLHELGHGLGFFGSLEVSGAQGQWGVLSGGFTGAPFIFDRFNVNGAGQQLIDSGLFPNPSAALAAQLTSDNVFFDAPHTNAAAGGTAARLYAPATWEEGSSISHLDEDTYPAGDQDSLMTPVLRNGESILDPGPITRGIFQDLGWTVSTDTPIAGLAASSDGPTTIGSPTTLLATITDGTNVAYAWNFGDGTTGSGATVTHMYSHVGSYTATVTASNAQGSKTASTTVQIRDLAIAGLTASNNGPTNLGNPTTLAATITAGTNVSYAWNFGDGVTGSGATPSHAYGATGTYTATVTASNSQGSKTASTTVKVLASTASATITPTGGTLATPDNSIRVSFPTNAVSTTVVVTYTALLSPTHPLPSTKRLLRGFTLEARTTTGVPVTTFGPPVTIVISYTDADIAAGNIAENTVEAVFWDGSAWSDIEPCAGCSVSTTNNRVTLVLDHLTEFAIVGDGQGLVYVPLARN